MLQPEVFRHFPSSEIRILPTISCRQNQQASWTPAMNLAPRRTYECVAVLKSKQRGRSLASSASEVFTRLHHRTSLEPKRFLHHIQTPMPSPSQNLRKRILASIPNSDAPQRPATAATNPNQNKPAPPPHLRERGGACTDCQRREQRDLPVKASRRRHLEAQGSIQDTSAIGLNQKPTDLGLIRITQKQRNQEEEEEENKNPKPSRM